ncbi:MAG: hypothetical protein K0S65_4202, partial [Labilithrix sp.]|nr:hypothetical protein [Labilithrix sp.]
MKTNGDDPRHPHGYGDPGERDTRLDPIEDLPDATQPGSVLMPPAAADLVTPHSPQLPVARPVPLEDEPEEVLFPGTDPHLTPPPGTVDMLRSSDVPRGPGAFR